MCDKIDRSLNHSYLDSSNFHQCIIIILSIASKTPKFKPHTSNNRLIILFLFGEVAFHRRENICFLKTSNIFIHDLLVFATVLQHQSNCFSEFISHKSKNNFVALSVCQMNSSYHKWLYVFQSMAHMLLYKFILDKIYLQY